MHSGKYSASQNIWFERMFKDDTYVPEVKEKPVHRIRHKLNILCAWKRIIKLLVLDLGVTVIILIQTKSLYLTD